MKFSVGDLPNKILLGLLGAMTLFPIYFVLTNSFKSQVEYAQGPLGLPSVLRLENYVAAWSRVGGPMLNSSVIVFTSVVAILAFASLSAYAFALMNFPGRTALFGLVFTLLLIPAFLTLIPLYLQIKRTGLSNNYLALILPYIAAGQAFAIFVLKTFFENIPRELLEAARIDGANDFFVFWRIVLPLSRAVLVSVGIISLVPLWNDYLLPQLVLDRSNATLTMALVVFQGNPESFDAPNYGALMAAYALASVPLVILFSFLMRAYVEGLTSGGVKA